jgi:glucose-6-phosphate isomerase
MPAPVVERPAWAALRAHHAAIHDVHLRTLFADDPGRGERMTAEGAGLYLDYSKNRLTSETLRLLLALAEESEVHGRMDAMFRGEHIKRTENRAVLHVALRAPRRSASSSTARTSCPRCTRCSTGWRTSRAGVATARGRAHRAARCGTS